MRPKTVGSWGPPLTWCERDAIAQRLNQITTELNFANVTNSHADSLAHERASLQWKLASPIRCIGCGTTISQLVADETRHKMRSVCEALGLTPIQVQAKIEAERPSVSQVPERLASGRR